MLEASPRSVLPDESTAVPGQRQDGVEGTTVAWLVLVLSGVLEAVWATALGRSNGFTRVAPSLVFVVAALASFAGLAHAMRSLPIGTAYAVWVGIGAALTAGYAMWSGTEPASPARVLLLLGIVGCVVGLKITH
jgi:quaternary ammonium compound-resistance protein SugE